MDTLVPFFGALAGNTIIVFIASLVFLVVGRVEWIKHGWMMDFSDSNKVLLSITKLTTIILFSAMMLPAILFPLMLMILFAKYSQQFEWPLLFSFSPLVTLLIIRISEYKLFIVKYGGCAEFLFYLILGSFAWIPISIYIYATSTTNAHTDQSTNLHFIFLCVFVATMMLSVEAFSVSIVHHNLIIIKIRKLVAFPKSHKLRKDVIPTRKRKKH